MKCPVCFADSSHSGDDLELGEIHRRLTMILQKTGALPLQISGGEPTLHPKLPEIVKLAKNLGFINIELVTNGITISTDPNYLFQLVQKGLTAVYLQFDGLHPETHLHIRGQDMRNVRSMAIHNIRKVGICCTLAVALIQGVNDVEIGEIIRFGIKNIDTVRAINFQAATPFQGRFPNQSDTASLPLSQLIQLIEINGALEPGGFSSQVLGHPECNAMSLCYVVNGTLKPLFNSLNMEKILQHLGENKRVKILELFHGKKRFLGKLLLTPHVWPRIIEAHSMFKNRLNPFSLFQTPHILLFAKSFMGCNELNKKRLKQCNYGIVVNDGIYSFCAYNNLHRIYSKKR